MANILLKCRIFLLEIIKGKFGSFFLGEKIPDGANMHTF